MSTLQGPVRSSDNAGGTNSVPLSGASVEPTVAPNNQHTAQSQAHRSNATNSKSILSIADFILQLSKPGYRRPTQGQRDYRQVEMRDRLNAYLRRHNLDLNAIGSEGLTPLHMAVRLGLPDLAELLLLSGADAMIEVNSADVEVNRRSPLRYSGILKSEGMHNHEINLQMYEVFEYDRLVKKYPEEQVVIFDAYEARTTTSYNPSQGVVMTVQQLQQHVSLNIPSYQGPQFERLLWIHTHSTNVRVMQLSILTGVILAKIARALQSFLLTPSRPVIIPDSFCRWRFTAPGVSDTPGDRLLRCQKPIYKSDLTGEERKCRAIAFPCLVLRTVKYHKELREKVKDMDSLYSLEPRWPMKEYNHIQLERTLDEAYYPGLSEEALKDLNRDQVVMKALSIKSDNQKSDSEIPILTVPQLWLWRLDNVVVSAYASAEQLGQGEFYNGTESPVTLLPDLHMGHILAHHVKAFNCAYEDGPIHFEPVLNIFETAMMQIQAEVNTYMKVHGTRLDIDKEADFIHNISDIRSEIVMIQDVLNQQEKVLSDFLKDPTLDKLKSTDNSKKEANDWASVHTATQLISHYRERTHKIDEDAQRIDQVIQNKLNLKRTAASIEDAHQSVAEARQSKLLSIVVLGFAIITIIFTPISFLAALLALDIDTFDGIKYTPVSTDAANSSDSQASAVFSGKKMAGLFVGTEILTIILTCALTVGIGYLLLRYLDKLIEILGRDNTRTGIKATDHRAPKNTLGDQARTTSADGATIAAGKIQRLDVGADVVQKEDPEVSTVSVPVPPTQVKSIGQPNEKKGNTMKVGRLFRQKMSRRKGNKDSGVEVV